MATTAIPVELLGQAVEACSEWADGYNPEEPQAISWNGKLMYSRPLTAVIFTDACEWQRGVWVAADEEQSFPAIDRTMPFVREEIYQHITLQETAAAADGQEKLPELCAHGEDRRDGGTEVHPVLGRKEGKLHAQSDGDAAAATEKAHTTASRPREGSGEPSGRAEPQSVGYW